MLGIDGKYQSAAKDFFFLFAVHLILTIWQLNFDKMEILKILLESCKR